MAELVVGKKYKITKLHPGDYYYRWSYDFSEEATYLGKTLFGNSNFDFKDGEIRTIMDGFTYEECCGEGCCELPPKEAEFATMEFATGTKYPTPTFKLIEIVSDSLKDLLQYKNKRYGDTALQPIGVFSKTSAETGLLQRIDDKISRIKTSPELRKNDVCDLMGYLTLLCISKDWYNFDEFKD